MGQKCLKTYVNCIFNFLFVFLNLSSKVLVVVKERASKYPYMDICDILCPDTEALYGYGILAFDRPSYLGATVWSRRPFATRVATTPL